MSGALRGHLCDIAIAQLSCHFFYHTVLRCVLSAEFFTIKI